jgi:hypothetical protein
MLGAHQMTDPTGTWESRSPTAGRIDPLFSGPAVTLS